MMSNSELYVISTRFNCDLRLPSNTLTFFQKSVFYLGSRILITYHLTLRIYSDRDSSVGVATRYGLGGPGIESPVVAKIFRTGPDRPWGPPGLLYNGYRVFRGGKAAGAWR